MPNLCIHNLCQAFPDKNMERDQNADTYKHVYMKTYTVIREKCTCYIAWNSHQIHDVEKMFLGVREIYIWQKIIFGPHP